MPSSHGQRAGRELIINIPYNDMTPATGDLYVRLKVEVISNQSGE